MNKDLQRVVAPLLCSMIVGCAANNSQPTANNAPLSVTGNRSAITERDPGLRAVLNAVNPQTGQMQHLPAGTKIYSIGGFVVRDGNSEYAFAPPAKYSINSFGRVTVQYDGHVQQFSRVAYVSTSSETTQYIVVYPGDPLPKAAQGRSPVYVVK